MIVEFIEGRDFLTAWAPGPAGRRLALLTADGREMTIAADRALNSVELPDPGAKGARLELLRAAEAARRNLAAEIDLAELWSVLEGEGREFAFEALAALVFGRRARADEISAVARAVFADGLRFRFTPAGALRRSQEEVDKLSAARRLEEEAERNLAIGRQWLADLKRQGAAPEPSEAAGLKARLINFALTGTAGDRSEIKKTLAEAGFAPEPAGAVRALELAGEFGPHENLDLRRLEFPVSFAPELLETARRLAARRSAAGPDADREKRRDLTALTALTIDSNGARDMDDAVSIKALGGGRWQAGIHITDAAALIPPDSPLDLAARRRAASVYLPDGKYPMLPPELTDGLLSLTKGDIKPALSFLVTVNQDGTAADYEFFLSRIRVDRQLSFAEADAALGDVAELVDLWDLAQALQARRLAQGALKLNLPRLNIHFLPDGSLNAGLSPGDTPAKLLIEELMILANHLAADLLHKKGYPCPYRFQGRSREPAPAELIDPAAAGAGGDRLLAASLAARRRAGRGGLSFSPSPHRGLGLPVYTSFTAPMRRYLDLLVARQLRSLIMGRPPALDQAAFQRLALPVHEYAQTLRKMQSGRQRYWLKQHLRDKIGRVGSALVFERRDRRLRVCVTDYMLETELLWPKGAGSPPPDPIGRRIKVRLAEVPAGEAPPRYEVLP